MENINRMTQTGRAERQDNKLTGCSRCGRTFYEHFQVGHSCKGFKPWTLYKYPEVEYVSLKDLEYKVRTVLFDNRYGCGYYQVYTRTGNDWNPALNWMFISQDRAQAWIDKQVVGTTGTNKESFSNGGNTVWQKSKR